MVSELVKNNRTSMWVDEVYHCFPCPEITEILIVWISIFCSFYSMNLTLHNSLLLSCFPTVDRATGRMIGLKYPASTGLKGSHLGPLGCGQICSNLLTIGWQFVQKPLTSNIR